jgi:hypothetical protein
MLLPSIKYFFSNSIAFFHLSDSIYFPHTKINQIGIQNINSWKDKLAMKSSNFFWAQWQQFCLSIKHEKESLCTRVVAFLHAKLPCPQ